MDDTARNASRILLKFVTDRDSKLKYGSKLRAMMQESINRGEEPTGYRVDWILKTVNEMFAWLGTKAAEFNSQYPQDAISADDFADVLATAQTRLRNPRRR